MLEANGLDWAYTATMVKGEGKGYRMRTVVRNLTACEVPIARSNCWLKIPK